MRLFAKLAKEILWKKTWAVISAIIAFVGNIPAIIEIAEFVLEKDLSYLENSPIVSGFLSFMSDYWYWILTIVLISAFANGIFQKSRNYLGDRIVAEKITFTPKEGKHKQDGEEKYAWLVLQNDEDFDLREVYAVLKTIKIRSGDMWLPWEEIANENISHLTFPEFQNKEVVVHSGHPVRLNIAKTPDGNSVLLIFQRGDKSIPHSGEGIYIEVVVGGIDYGRNGEIRKIVDKVFKGFLVSENGLDAPYEMQVASTETREEIKGNRKVVTTVRTEDTLLQGPHRWYRLYLKEGTLE
jgi:hypothetical protein